MEKEFIDLLNRHPGILYKVCSLFCHTTDDRNDLFQEIVLQLWKSYPQFRKDASVTTWMYRVALNTAISNYRRKTGKVRFVPYSGSELHIPDLRDTAADASIKALYDAIEQLSTIEKALIMLYLDDKSYEEISTIMGLSKTNVGVKLNRIKAKLDKLIHSPTR